MGAMSGLIRRAATNRYIERAMGAFSRREQRGMPTWPGSTHANANCTNRRSGNSGVPIVSIGARNGRLGFCGKNAACSALNANVHWPNGAGPKRNAQNVRHGARRDGQNAHASSSKNWKRHDGTVRAQNVPLSRQSAEPSVRSGAADRFRVDNNASTIWHHVKGLRLRFAGKSSDMPAFAVRERTCPPSSHELHGPSVWNNAKAKPCNTG